MNKALVLVPLLALAVGARSAEAGAPGSVGGHVGVSLSLLGMTAQSDGLFRNSVIGDGHTHLSYPIGITLMKTKRLAFDWEMVIHSPDTDGGDVKLTIDPGILYRMDGYKVGLRVSMNIAATANYGAIALIQKGWKIAPKVWWFIEGDVPVVYDVNTRSAGINAILHSGIGF